MLYIHLVVKINKYIRQYRSPIDSSAYAMIINIQVIFCRKLKFDYIFEFSRLAEFIYVLIESVSIIYK